MSSSDHFCVVAIPLSRPSIVDFLLPPRPEPRGAVLQTVGQRPTAQAEAKWIAHLHATIQSSVADLLLIDNPHGHLRQTHTDRLIPVEFLAEPKFLTNNLGGWAPIYFEVVGLPAEWPDDPLLNQAELLTDYGQQIRYFGADPDQVATRLEEETGIRSSTELAAALSRLYAFRQQSVSERSTYIQRIYQEIAAETYAVVNGQPPIPALLLYDELLGQLVQLELDRRAALARDDQQRAEAIAAWQLSQQQRSGLKLILKGEYVMGRHRRSTVLLAPKLGVAIKQPAPEPFHQVKLGAKVVDGQQENWPYTTHDGLLVTPRGRLRLVIEEDLVPRLNHIFGHEVRFSTLLGLIVEPFVEGQTVQELVLEDSSRLTPDLYEVFVLHQQVCEAMGIENGDWHSANFIMRSHDGQIVHIDWGAARPLTSAELTSEGRLARLNQVKNIGFSFHDEALADRVLKFHTDLVADQDRLARIRRQAQVLADT